MNPELQKIIHEQMKTIPEDIAVAIISVEYQSKLREVAKRQRLMIDQAGKLELETTLVMIGLEPISDYVANLERELDIPLMRAKEIAMDVSENIFKPVRLSLKSMSETLTEEGETDEQTPDDILNNESQKKEEAAKFTNTNEVNLNRDQILNEIENPATIEGGGRTMEFAKKTSEIQKRPTQEIKIISPEENKNVNMGNTSTNMVEAKMSGMTIISKQTTEAKPETKLPEISARQENSASGDKKRPYGGVDPYREELI